MRHNASYLRDRTHTDTDTNLAFIHNRFLNNAVSGSTTWRYKHNKTNLNRSTLFLTIPTCNNKTTYKPTCYKTKLPWKTTNPLQAIPTKQNLTKNTFEFRFTKPVPDAASTNLLLAIHIRYTRQQLTENLWNDNPCINKYICTLPNPPLLVQNPHSQEQKKIFWITQSSSV